MGLSTNAVTSRAARKGGPPFSFQSPDDGSLLGAILLGGGCEASGRKGAPGWSSRG